VDTVFLKRLLTSGPVTCERDSAGFCKSIRVLRCRPLRESELASNRCQR
jgi:hypothetical protein